MFEEIYERITMGISKETSDGGIKSKEMSESMPFAGRNA